MKFLIENYSDYTNTQSLYFSSVLKNLGHECNTYNQKGQSIYDALDKNNPDYFITHANLLTNDYVVYVNNEKSNIKLLLNVTGLTNEQVVDLDKNFDNDNINCPMFFTNMDQKLLPKIKHRKILAINDCADLNLLKTQSKLKYDMPKAFFLLDKLTYTEFNPHHTMTNIVKLKKDVDIFLPETQLSALYTNYAEVIFYGIKSYIPQSFFDAILLGCKVYYITDNNQPIDFIDAVLKPNSSLNYFDHNKMQDFNDIREYVKEKHSSQNRVKTLLSQLPKE
jgi:hypothetical protein